MRGFEKSYIIYDIQGEYPDISKKKLWIDSDYHFRDFHCKNANFGSKNSGNAAQLSHQNYKILYPGVVSRENISVVMTLSLITKDLTFQSLM